MPMMKTLQSFKEEKKGNARQDQPKFSKEDYFIKDSDPFSGVTVALGKVPQLVPRNSIEKKGLSISL